MDAVSRLESLLKHMDVPVNRSRVNFNNLRWLDRNLWIRNEGHPSYKEASSLIKQCLKDKLYKN